MIHRVKADREDIELLVHAWEEKRQNILDEMLAPGQLQDELVEAVEALRQVDSRIKRWTKILWSTNIKNQEVKSGEADDES